MIHQFRTCFFSYIQRTYCKYSYLSISKYYSWYMYCRCIYYFTSTANVPKLYSKAEVVHIFLLILKNCIFAIAMYCSKQI